jgi:uncharacterized RDD family membrane protein YckC
MSTSHSPETVMAAAVLRLIASPFVLAFFLALAVLLLILSTLGWIICGEAHLTLHFPKSRA